MRVRLSTLALSVALLGVLPHTAAASPIAITLDGSSDHTLGAYIVMDYVGLTSTTGTLTLAIANISESWDPRLTSFAFNAPGGTSVPRVTGITSFNTSISGWSYIFSPNSVDTPGQFGLFDVAGVTHAGNFNGGSPNNGIARNVTGNFTFGLTGLGMTTMTTSSFVNLLSYDKPGGANEAEQYFIARFQRTGANGQGSDVAIPTGPPGPPPTSVPEPTSLMLLGVGGVVMALRRRNS